MTVPAGVGVCVGARVDVAVAGAVVAVGVCVGARVDVAVASAAVAVGV